MARSSSSGLTLVVMSEDKLPELVERARPLVEAVQRHKLDLLREGLARPELSEGDGCCNCVAC